MSNVVAVTGVNTSQLPKLDNAKMMELLKKVKQGDEFARDEFIIANLRLVLSVVQRFGGKRGKADDMFQVGCVGLIKAMDNFNMDLNVKFSTYAVPMIIGEIRRYLRDNSKIRVSRSMKDIAYKSLQFKDEYFFKNGSEPSIEEIAEKLGVEKIDVVIALEAIQEPISVYTPIYNSGSDEIYLIDQIPDNQMTEEKRLNQIIIEEGISRLNDRLKGIIYNRYYENKTQMEIAEEMNISQAQVSRLEKAALKIIFNK